MPATQKAGQTTRGRDRPTDDERAGSAAGITAFLYRADDEDDTVDIARARATRLRKDDLLWIDVDLEAVEDVAAIAAAVNVNEDQLHLPARDDEPPGVRDYGTHFTINLHPIHRIRGRWSFDGLTCVVGDNWLVTARRGELTWLTAFDEHVKGESTLGRLDAPTFVAQLLEWMLAAYFEATDELQGRVDKLEEGILSGHAEDETLRELVTLRRKAGELRRRLAPQRHILATLAHPSFDVLADTNAAGDFALLNERLEQVVQAVDTTREMVVGAVDLWMTQTAQRTNEIMRVLTIVSVVLLPASLLAGIMGMNMLPDYLVTTAVFWAVLVVIVALIAGALALMHRRRWL